MKAMIFAAGIGSRLRPITDKIPKALIKIGDTVLLELIIKRLIAFGYNQIIINIHHLAEQITRFIKENNSFGIEIVFSDETGLLLDSGGGLKKASWFFKNDETILLHNVDIISDINLNSMLDYHQKHGSIATLAVRDRKTQRYFVFDDQMRLSGWKNKATNEVKWVDQIPDYQSDYAFSGIHLIESEIINYLPDINKFSIIDEYLKIAKHSEILGYDHSDTNWIDIGKPDSLPKALGVLNQIRK